VRSSLCSNLNWRLCVCEGGVGFGMG
jgi:hypothetical protein